jgi:peptidyl-prolyl cis-trans isomerase SurA
MAVVLMLAAIAPARPEVVNRIVATIDGEPVTLFELDSFTDQARRRVGGGDPRSAEPRAMLDDLILEKIVKKQVEAQGISANDRQIDAYIGSIRERNELTEAQLREVLSGQGLTWEQYREQIRNDIERAGLINKEIREKVNVSPEEVERYYQAHLDEYKTPARVSVRLISLLVPAGAPAEHKAAIRTEAESVREQAAGGKDFAALAKAHSQGPGAAEGGDLGEIAHGQMQAEFEEAAFTVKAGEVSHVIETSTGYHIIKVEKRVGESHQPLDEVADAIREKLYNEAIEERYERWLRQDLRARHNVEILL